MPAFWILLLVVLISVWGFISFVVYPIGIEPLLRIYKNKFWKLKHSIDETVDEINEREDNSDV